VHCAFVFDTAILGSLPSRTDRRVEFILRSVLELKASLESRGGGLHVLHGDAREEIPRIAQRLGVAAVYANRDYEPAALARDAAVAEALSAHGIEFHTRKDQVIFEAGEIRTQAGGSFSVYTPYKNAWLKRLEPIFLKPYPVERHAAKLAPAPKGPPPTLQQLGFESTDLDTLGIEPGMSGAQRLLADFRRRIDAYRERRDYPGLKGPSYLSVHLRFGTVSIRALARYAHRHGSEGSATWLSELIWRDFYFMVLATRPDVVDAPFRRECAALRFEFREDWWQAWCHGRTGYPLVDAAMRQLNRTGYMHNRLRMVAASFLVKHLGIDWRRGERYFAERLNDYDLAANNGGWQWAASTGCDAQPWFRIFNPVAQSQRFDAQGRFILRYVPELARVPPKWLHAPWTMDPATQDAAGCRIGQDYPPPVVDHAEARQRTLARFAVLRQPAPR
jgi:deoxyribodipyrimidine photo-lyase